MPTTTNLTPLTAEQPTFKILGVLVQFLTTPNEISSDIGVIRTIIPPGTVIPLHMHADPEIFYLLEGTLEVFQQRNQHGEWLTLKPGELAVIEGSVIHAIRNTFEKTVMCLVITKKELYSFLHELAHPHGRDEPIGPPTAGELQELIAVADKYKYWLASPQENAEMGVFVENLQELSK